MGAACVTVLPLISQIARLPALSRHTMSAMPSPLKSPVATIDQVVGTLPRPAALGSAVPLRNQIATSPVAVLRHRMSALWSLSKSAKPEICQAVGTLPRLADELTAG